MYVTATEFKTNFGKYLDLIAKEDVYITKNGRTVARISPPKARVVKELCGCVKLPADISDKELLSKAREDRFESFN